MATDPILGEAVREGAAWLDENYPGWEQRVTKPIVMWSPQQCVLGQAVPVVEGQSSGYASALHLHPNDLIHAFDGEGRLGFAVNWDSNMPGIMQYEALAQLWERLLAAREMAAAALAV